jgi:hypothetical protein
MAGSSCSGSARQRHTPSFVGFRKVASFMSLLALSLAQLTVEGFEPTSALVRSSSKDTYCRLVTGLQPWKSSDTATLGERKLQFTCFLRCKCKHRTPPTSRLALNAETFGESHEINPSTNSDSISPAESTGPTRRKALAVLLAGATALDMPTFNDDGANTNNVAWAITREYPVELTSVDVGVSSRRKMAEEKVQKARAQTISKSTEDPLKLRDGIDVATTIVWSGALWLGLGSRSNFLVRPLANLLYEANNSDNNVQETEQTTENTVISSNGDDAGAASSVAVGKTSQEQEDEDEGAFVRDRNEGYFSDLPFGLSFVLAAVFIASGWALNRFLTLFLLGGDSDLNLQLAGVALINGGALELGRLVSGEKQMTRDEVGRALRLQEEFQQFAGDRLLVLRGGNVHRSEVSASFRRYYAKYRNIDESSNSMTNNDQSMLVTDLEIERLMRSWNRQSGSRADMSRAGFFTGVQLNKAADITSTSFI